MQLIMSIQGEISNDYALSQINKLDWVNTDYIWINQTGRFSK